MGIILSESHSLSKTGNNFSFNLLNKLHQMKRFTNAYITLSVFFILPVIVVEAEISFSALARVKTFSAINNAQESTTLRELAV